MRQDRDDGKPLTAYSQYIREIKWIAPLTDEEEAKLLQSIAYGVDALWARDRLVEGYLHIVIGLASRFVRDCKHLDLLDFVQEGNLGLLEAMMLRLRENPPRSFAGSPVEAAVDLSEGSDELPPTEGLLWITRDGTRVIIRPSGTEPKLKCYLEVIRPVDS